MNENFFDHKFVDQKVLITLQFLNQHFLTKNVSDPIFFSFRTEIFVPKDFVVLRPRGKLECGFAQLYLFNAMSTMPYDVVRGH